MKGSEWSLVGALGLLITLGACAGGGEEPAAEEEAIAAADLIGYYAYGDPVRGGFHLALLEDSRFLLVAEPPEASPGAEPVPGEEIPAGTEPFTPIRDSEGVVGWYVLRGDSLYLNSEDMYARGVVTLGILRLEMVDPPGEVPEARPFPVTFERAAGPAGASEGQGGKGGGGSDQQGGGQS